MVILIGTIRNTGINGIIRKERHQINLMEVNNYEKNYRNQKIIQV